MDFDFRHLALLPPDKREEAETLIAHGFPWAADTTLKVAVFDRLRECGETPVDHIDVVNAGGETLLALMLDLDMGD